MKNYEIFKNFFPYDLDTLENMYNVRFCGMPISFLLLDSRKTNTHCHFCASFLKLVIPNSIKKTGKITRLNGNEHSWVEVDDLVYDTSLLTVWNKKDYYEKEGICDVSDSHHEEIETKISDYLSSTGCLELYVAWIRDLESNFDKNPYRRILQKHIELFEKEKNIDESLCNKELLEIYVVGLKKVYDEIDNFVEQNQTPKK